MSRPDTFTHEDEMAITSATKILCSRYRGHVSHEDVRQELYLWLFTHYDRAQRWREELSEKHAERTLIRALRNAGEVFCREEKAQHEGYKPEDEFFYSIPMVADLLQLYFDGKWMIPPAMQMTRTSGGKPASEGGNLMTMVADVGRAFESLPAPDRTLLRNVYGGTRPVADAIAILSIQWECSQSAANSRIRRVVGRVRAKLGGPAPYRKDTEDE
jgi:hypothetical protein